MLPLLLAAAVAAQASAAPPTPAPAVQPIRAAKVVLVGDSTTAVVGGWGGSFCAEHVLSFLACVNLARGGRSSGSYIAEGSWAVALAEARAAGFQPVWMLIQFGHNDQPGKPGRSTDLASEFPANLRRYVAEARAAGATPVLLTPLTRRTFKDGKLVRDLDPWADAVRRVARETGTPLVDLNRHSADAVEAMGEAAADRFAQLPKGAPATGDGPAGEVNDQPMARRKLSFDRTHLGRAGADYFAAMVTRDLAIAVPAMRRYLYE